MNTASSFGRRLRLERERLGISLESIAASTKINRSLLADLEQGDLTKWPPGIYRRAFVREYAAAIGLPAEKVVAEFSALFPDETPAVARSLRAEPSKELRLTLAAEDRSRVWIGRVWRLLVATIETPVVARSLRAEPSNELRLTLAEHRNEARIGRVRRLVVASIELCAIVGLGWLLAAVTKSEFWTVCGAIALTYYPIVAACSSRIPTFEWPGSKPLFNVSGRRYVMPSSRLIQLILHRTPGHSADQRTV
jgi:transcriptional regulator with XRE-family HTH domain